ncbi:hypothetical protein pb186bvf_010345 [Paramecium bursaria]
MINKEKICSNYFIQIALIIILDQQESLLQNQFLQKLFLQKKKLYYFVS